MKSMIGVLGGTFDPIHDGHLAMARFARAQLDLSKVLLIPAGFPWQRQPRASAEDRLHMAELAVAQQPFIEVDAREIRRHTPTYTLDTLEELRTVYGSDQPFCLILGSDAFLNLPTWKEWMRVLDLAHVAVLCRPGFDLPIEHFIPPLREAWNARQSSVSDIRNSLGGRMIRLEMPPMPISSTQIRHALAHSLPSLESLLPPPVLNYIETHHLYRPLS
ncbi:nicotinate-nucleotide adenylyltransferase [Ferrovum sp.]|uniref:nicotinate-nucleotide adenylyltransferase n=1 Tax=Ferrovum sp. TaxID=2609467 RepID=UPI0026038B4D|nr:nicotinate-nucleotide adenylyltransferase [Ferrovum sp.]